MLTPNLSSLFPVKISHDFRNFLIQKNKNKEQFELSLDDYFIYNTLQFDLSTLDIAYF